MIGTDRHKHKQGRRNQAGFTLVEVMSVLLIIGLMTAVVVISLPPKTDPLITDGQAIRSDLRALAQAAIVQQKPFGLILRKDGYEIVRYENGLWRSVGHKNPKAKGAALFLYKDGLKIDVKKAEKLGEPLIRFDTTGLATPFELRIEAGAQTYIIHAGPDGKISTELIS